jgi:hypothetical protein
MSVFSFNKQLVYWFVELSLICNVLVPLGENRARLLASEKQGAPGKESTAFWQNKQAKEWSPQELQLFLQDSPWAKTEKIIVPVKSRGNPTPPQSTPVVGAIQMIRVETCCRTFEVPIAGQTAESTNSNLSGDTSNTSTETSGAWTFSARVLWFSSVSIRRALVRQRQMQGMPMEQVQMALAPSNDIVLAISGTFLKLLEGLPLADVRKISSIRTTKGMKRKLSPTEYIPAQPNADPMAFLIFPKTLEDKPVFSLEDGTVMFSMEGIDFKLECQFPLEPMVVDGKLDW